MRRKAWFRSLATLLAIWLPLIVGEPGVLHACPTHGVGATPSVASAHQHRAHSTGTTRQGATEHGSPTQHQGPAHDHHDCTCISCCVGSVASAPPPPVPTTSFEVAVYTADVSRSTTSLPRSTPDYSRPYTTGPPRA